MRRSRAPGGPARLLWLLVALLLAPSAGCASSGGSDGGAGAGRGPTSLSSQPSVNIERAAGTTAPTTPEHGLGEGTAPAHAGRRALRGFSEVAVTITEPGGGTCRLCLLAATTEVQRERGLMEVTDPALGGYDGMLFEFPEDQNGAFWMRNTPMPLSIAYLDRSGAVVSTVDMAPCGDEATCPSYRAGGAFRYALEVPQGGLGDIGVRSGSTLRIDARRCPHAAPGG